MIRTFKVVIVWAHEGGFSCAVVNGWWGNFSHTKIEPMKKLEKINLSNHERPFG